MPDNLNWETVHDSAVTNTTPDSNVHVTLDTAPICSNMSDQEFRHIVMKARDAGAKLIKDRIAGVARWDTQEQERATTFFGRADEKIRSTLVAGLPKLLAAMEELVPEKIVRWDDSLSRNFTCAVKPDAGNNAAAVCKPDSQKRIIAIYSKFCRISTGELWHECKVKTLIHECTHYTDTFASDDIMYGDTEIGMKLFAMNNPDRAIKNADSITGYVGTFDKKTFNENY